MVCVDMLNRIKVELITEAMDTLQEAIDAKAISVEGELVNLPDKPSETEMHMFVIRQLVEQRDSIIERYRGQLNDDKPSDPKMVAQRERLSKFILYVEQIYTLMHYGDMLDSWMNEIALQVGSKSPSEAMVKTLNEQRIEVIKYVLGNKKISSEGILTEVERKILMSSISGSQR